LDQGLRGRRPPRAAQGGGGGELPGPGQRRPAVAGGRGERGGPRHGRSQPARAGGERGGPAPGPGQRRGDPPDPPPGRLPLTDPAGSGVSDFGPPPARDARFTVKDRWSEMENIPPEDPRHALEFLHRQMNEEVNSIEISARNLTDFKDADWELRMAM